jgi:hypothetical protein
LLLLLLLRRCGGQRLEQPGRRFRARPGAHFEARVLLLHAADAHACNIGQLQRHRGPWVPPLADAVPRVTTQDEVLVRLEAQLLQLELKSC